MKQLFSFLNHRLIFLFFQRKQLEVDGRAVVLDILDTGIFNPFHNSSILVALTDSTHPCLGLFVKLAKKSTMLCVISTYVKVKAF
jgi:hypothetical protein